MITFKTEVRIERPIEEVYTYVSDPLNFPSWNSAVQDVRENPGGKTYSMERRLPTGRALNELAIVDLERPRRFGLRTVSGPTPFRYSYLFSPERGKTLVELDAQVELNGPAALLPQLAQRAVKNGVDENLATLKKILVQRFPKPRALVRFMPGASRLPGSPRRREKEVSP
jgi:uncharacterized membrane protein